MNFPAIFLSFFNHFINIHKYVKKDLYIRLLCLSDMTHRSFGTNFGSLEKLAADIWVMLYVHPFKVSNIFLLLVMFSFIFMNMQIRSFVFHTTGVKCKVSNLFSNKFGSLE